LPPELVLRVHLWHGVLTRVRHRGKVVAMAYEQEVQVQCYSGRSYADRPASFVWQDRQYQVKDIEKEWLEPGKRHFLVRTRGGGRGENEKSEMDEKRFEICYDERGDSWWLREV